VAGAIRQRDGGEGRVTEATPAVRRSAETPGAESPGVASTVQKYRQRCDQCGRSFGREFRTRCPDCSGLVEMHYDLGVSRLRDSADPYERFFDLLPILDPGNVLRIGDGSTPCVHAERLGASMGLEHVFLKVESVNPTGTTKDRMAAVVLSLFGELGVREFVTSSTGNSSNALAHALDALPDIRMHLFIGERFAQRFRYPSDRIELHVLEGRNFSEAFNVARTFAHDRGIAFEAGFFNPARREGLKMAYLEAVDQVPRPIDWYVQASSSAMGVYGTAKGAAELQALGAIPRIPRMVCVQQESCAPLVRGFEENLLALPERLVVSDPTGLAQAILRGDPRGCYPYVYRMLKDTDGAAVSVSDWEILEARRQLRQHEDLDCGFAAATTIAAIKKLTERRAVGAGDVVLLNLTD
jgi:threonine synthase